MKFQILVAAFVLLFVIKQSEGECESGQFQCADGTCIEAVNKCNGIMSNNKLLGDLNCPDDSDETYDLCNSNPNNGGCFWRTEMRCPGKKGCFSSCD